MQRTQKDTFFLRWITVLATTLAFSWLTSAMAATPAEIQEWLQAHNNYRTLHGVPPVTWSETVAASAQAYADTCPSGHSGSVYGENLAWASYSMGESGVVELWYDKEEQLYDYNNPGFSSDTGHFTQVVWKGTTEIGCGFASGCGSDWPYMSNAWVCQYNPPGNYLGRFAENVFPPGSGNGDDGGGDQGGGGQPSANAGKLVPILTLLLL